MLPVHRVLFCSALAASLGVVARAADPVLLSFAVTGDCRIDPTNPKIAAKDFSADWLKDLSPDQLGRFHHLGGADGKYPFFFNIVQMRQDLKDLAALQPAPSYFFITGDLVAGFQRNDQGATLKDQLEDFQTAVQTVKLPGSLQLVPLPGNHEMTFKEFQKNYTVTVTGDDEADQATWRSWMSGNRYDTLGSNGPGSGTLIGKDDLAGLDAIDTSDAQRAALAALKDQVPINLKDDQSRMTYSFDSRSVHFVVLNTDTISSAQVEEADNDNREEFQEEGLVPLAWVRQDLANAQKNDQIKHIFVLGHKPILYPRGLSSKGKPVTGGPDDTLNAALAEPLRQLLIQNSKVRAYLVSHVHLWHADSLADGVKDGDASTRPVQIVAGNGGTYFEKFWTPDGGPYFGFTLVKVHQSGRVTYNSYQRPAPAPIFGGPASPAQPRPASVEIK
jgi:hypothetical protein